jgi:hypothetical protein
VYCIFTIAAGLAATVLDGVVWAANYNMFHTKHFSSPFPQPDPTLGEINASLWQLKGNVTIKWFDDDAGVTKHTVVDLNSSLMQDPSGIH